MPTLLTTNLWTEITAAATESRRPSHVAVAYFGEKGPTLLPLPRGSVLVVDASIPTVSQGATSPSALRRLLQLRGVNIFSAQYLHAKVFAFDGVAFVGSPNASQHSADTLVEAALRVDSANEISKIRDFVNSLRITRLNVADLRELSKFYRRPKSVEPSPAQGKFSTLLMELTLEQGGGRETQVQPPKGVWQNFFGLDPARGVLPTLTLINEKSTPKIEMKRKVVSHHHTYTIEISGAELPRPAILQMKRIGPKKYSYIVHRPNDPSFSTVSHLVRTLHNPFWESGRRWVLV